MPNGSRLQRRMSTWTKRAVFYNNDLKAQIKVLSRFRPFFTNYILIVQALVLLISLATHSYAPIRADVKPETHTSAGADGSQETLTNNMTGNLFIGVRRHVLIRLGAMYAPCMRRDDRLKALVKQQRTLAENMGCCTHSAGQYCYVSTPDECTGLGQFHNDSVCYGPKCCVEPETWPGCVYPEQTPPGEDFDICRCQMTARPCCTGLLGDCSIKTQEQCEFLDGIFHANASSCAEVSCLDSVCGLSPFANEGIPDQWYRLLFGWNLPLGIAYQAVVMMAHSFLAYPLEQAIGWKRFALLYVSSAVGGYAVAAIFTPYEIKAGGSPALYGCLAALIVELLLSWKNIKSPDKQLFRVVATAAFALLIGTLPYIDNFAHVAGFVFGFVTALVVMPWQALGAWNRAKRRIMQLVALAVLVIMYVTVLTMLFTGQEANCSWCYKLNCINYVDGLCEQDETALV
eukprot:TRINITY_DN11201_c0_g1_i10.p1 TRINITY_DN11201_c0_g1~~TRINITY_DN11201_c0_g1_i10.p1  ORF type:complete len:458 (+),score=59.67 TRINITY_DN11201_c0_g1_i10:72-1445(+)